MVGYDGLRALSSVYVTIGVLALAGPITLQLYYIPSLRNIKSSCRFLYPGEVLPRTSALSNKIDFSSRLKT